MHFSVSLRDGHSFKCFGDTEKLTTTYSSTILQIFRAAPIDALTQTCCVSAYTVAAIVVHTFITVLSMHYLYNAFLFDITACTILHKYLGVL